MARKKSADMNQILMACAIGMISLIVGLIIFGIIGSYMTPDVTIGKAKIENITKTEVGDRYDVTVSLKNNEKKSVKVELKTAIGFDVYRKRRSTSPKPTLYRVFNALNESSQHVDLAPEGESDIRTTVEVGREIYERFEINQESKIYPRVTAEKVSWVDESKMP
jgi:hypothetical protein